MGDAPGKSSGGGSILRRAVRVDKNSRAAAITGKGSGLGHRDEEGKVQSAVQVAVILAHLRPRDELK